MGGFLLTTEDMGPLEGAADPGRTLADLDLRLHEAALAGDGPAQAECLLAMARLLLDAGEADQAVHCLEGASALAPPVSATAREARLGLVEAHLALGEARGALEAAEAALDLPGDGVPVVSRLEPWLSPLLEALPRGRLRNRLLQLQRDRAGALEALEAGAAREAQGDPEGAATWYREALAAGGAPPRERQALLTALARVRLVLGDRGRALENLARAMDVEGGDPREAARARRCLGWAHACAGHSAAALERLDGPGFLDAHDRALLLADLGRLQEALPHADRALGCARVREEAGRAMRTRAFILAGLGRFREAVGALLGAIAPWRDPGGVPAPTPFQAERTAHALLSLLLARRRPQAPAGGGTWIFAPGGAVNGAVHAPGGDDGCTGSEVGEAEYEALLLCRALALGRPPGAATLDRVREGMPEGALLLDHVAFPLRDPRTGRSMGTRYVVFLVERDLPGIRLVDLGEAQAPGGRGLEDEVRRFLAMAQDVAARGDADLWKTWLLRRLHARLVDIPDRHLSGGFLAGRTLVICPDGLLVRLPFGILQDADGVPLAVRHPLVALASVLDLLGDATPPGRGWGILAPAPPGDGEARRLRLLGTVAGMPLLEPGEAGARWLHLSLPGRVLDPGPAPAPTPDLPGAAEMLRAAGLERPWPPDPAPLRAPWRVQGLGLLEGGPGQVPDLAGCDLVCLPELQTVASHTGEGVSGLVRALGEAGARSVLLVLWEVPGPVRRAFLEGFYRACLGGLAGLEAFRRAQEDLRRDLVRGRHAYVRAGEGWARAGHARRGATYHGGGRRLMALGPAPAARRWNPVDLDLGRCPEYAWGAFQLLGRSGGGFHRDLDPGDLDLPDLDLPGPDLGDLDGHGR